MFIVLRTLLFFFIFLFNYLCYGNWEEHRGCVLDFSSYFDGDSFRVRLSDGRSFVFRLYFVDAIETDLSFPDRLKEQGAYFGVNDMRSLQFFANEARKAVAYFLSHPFTLWTRWESLGGRGTRYGAMIFLSNGKGLDEILVSNGLARIHGKKPHTPLGTSQSWTAHLKNLEKLAQERKYGIWGISK